MEAWAYPLAVWSVFFLVLLWTTLCLAAILRRRWEDEEHLPFPVLALPLEMTREGAPLYRQPLLWGGFAVPCVLHSLNSLQSIIPTLPTLKMNSVHDLIPDAILQPPLTGAGTLFYQLHPSGRRLRVPDQHRCLVLAVVLLPRQEGPGHLGRVQELA